MIITPGVMTEDECIAVYVHIQSRGPYRLHGVRVLCMANDGDSHSLFMGGVSVCRTAASR